MSSVVVPGGYIHFARSAFAFHDKNFFLSGSSVLISCPTNHKDPKRRNPYSCTDVEPRNKESTTTRHTLTSPSPRHTADFHTFTMEPTALTGSGDQGRRISKRKTTAPARITKDLGYVDKPKASDTAEAEDKCSSDRDGDSSSDEPMGVALGVNKDAALAK